MQNPPTLEPTTHSVFFVASTTSLKGTASSRLFSETVLYAGNTMVNLSANLPSERTVTTDPPFTFVGVDYFGPMSVKFRRGFTKRYGCIFTCLVTRAVHIEIAHSMDSDSFLMTLHRFMARRGKPNKLFSDNGTNFVAANKELADEIKSVNSKKLQDELLLEAIEWHFNPPHAPHMGGVWERLIRSCRKCTNLMQTESQERHVKILFVLGNTKGP